MESLFAYASDWVEGAFVARVVLDQGQTLIRLLFDTTPPVARIFATLAAAGINIDVITQTGQGDETSLAFTLAESDCALALRCLENLRLRNYTHTPVAKLSLEGVGVG